MARATTIGAGLLWLAAAGCGSEAEPQAPAPSPGPGRDWSFTGDLHGKTKDGQVQPAEDVSGMACAPAVQGARMCMAVDDETQGAQIVVATADHRLVPGQYLGLIEDRLGGKPLELDAEAVAFSDGAFYVIGSHGRPRNEDAKDGLSPAEKEQWADARRKAPSHLFRIRFASGAVDMTTGLARTKPRIDEAKPLETFFAPGSTLASQAGRPLEDDGLTIEGLAVRKADAVIGFRGPREGGAALLLEIPLAALFEGAAGGAKVVLACLGPDGRGNARGIRDLIAAGTTLFGIAGPVRDPSKKDPPAADYAAMRIQPGGTVTLRPLAAPDHATKPEALVPLEADATTFRGLVLFDGPRNGVAGAPGNRTTPAITIDFGPEPTSDLSHGTAACSPTGQQH